MSDHWAVIKKPLLYVMIPVAVALAGILGVALWADVPVSDLLRDANAILEGEFYVGLFSVIGITLWIATGAMCILVLSTGVTEEPRRLLMAGAAVSLMAGADDAFQIHETVGNYLGVSDSVIFGVYGIVAIVLFVWARRYLASTPNISVFVASAVLFGISLVFDLHLWEPQYSSIIEDIAKFLGIVAWVTFFGGVCRALIITPKVPAPTESHDQSTSES